jgi:hypothetical protein
MKKITSLLIAFALGISLANASIVSPITAQLVAENFYKKNNGSAFFKSTLFYTATSQDGLAVFYVFNINDNDGFVIVTADDNIQPIIGYSTRGKFVVPKHYTTIDFWMNARKKQINNIRANHYRANTAIANEWLFYLNNTPTNTRAMMSSVAPLIHTTWDQSPYYNDLCPGGSVTGCVATAMAQIMKFWNYPATGNDSSSYCDCTANNCTSNYGTLAVNYGANTYNWSNMPLNVSSPNNDVAKLMYDCGVSIEMDYSPSESSAYLTGLTYPSSQRSYLKYFKYDSTTLQDKYQSDYTNSAWVELLKNDLNIGRPIQFLGQDSTQGGHSWVCDGYDANNNFHMNWGWGGWDNGYFSIADFNTGGYNPVLYQEVLIGIQPMNSNTTTGIKMINSSEELKVYPNPASTAFIISVNNHVGKVHYSLFDVTGQQVKSGYINSNESTFNETISVTDLAKGIYFLKANDAQNAWSKKVEIK